MMSEEKNIFSWGKVSKELENVLDEVYVDGVKDYGQKTAARILVNKIMSHGAILADEVGLGKTRIALLLMEAVARAGGRVAAIVPQGLIFQWENELREIFKNSHSALLDNYIELRHFDDLFKESDKEKIKYPICQNDGKGKIRWALMSQNFGFLIRKTDNPKRYPLFNELKKVKFKGNVEKSQINSAARFLKKSNEISGAEIFKDVSRHTQFWKKVYKESNNNFANLCIKKLVGEMDFLVIDEAHKMRGDSSRLDVLVRDIIQMSCSVGGRLCLTATPIELRSQDWFKLIERCSQQKDPDADLKSAIDDFSNSLENARIYPENRSVIEDLCEKSKIFSEKMSEYVVRRRRCGLDEHRELLEGCDEKGAHPYRELGSVDIDLGLDNPDWLRAILCLEARSCAARGLKLSGKDTRKEKMLRYKYGAGMIDFDDDDDNIEVEGHKGKRLAFWKKQAKKQFDGNEESYSLENYPRILQTADYVERFLVNHPKEKILIFGVFTKPMRALSRELNDRYLIRMILENKIFRTDLSKKEGASREVDRLWKKYESLKKQKGEWFSDIERYGYDIDERVFKERAVEISKEYKRKYVNFRRTTSLKSLEDFIEERTSLIENELKRIQSKEKEDELAALKIFEMALKKKDCREVDTADGEGGVWQESIRRDYLSREVVGKKYDDVKKDEKEARLDAVVEIVLRYYRDMQSPSTTNDLEERYGSSKKITDDEIRISEKQMTKILKDENTTYGSSDDFCRFMNGDTDWFTRRKIQRQFNDEFLNPRVLIAQSLVGREGLNLHEQCRMVILFHSEWNPGVVEQEIGRVDRLNSLWIRKVNEWHNSDGFIDGEKCPYPKIMVRFVVFKGTYDEHQYNVLKKRRDNLDAQLFGALLPEEVMKKVPKDMYDKIRESAPDFFPKDS